MVTFSGILRTMTLKTSLFCKTGDWVYLVPGDTHLLTRKLEQRLGPVMLSRRPLLLLLVIAEELFCMELTSNIPSFIMKDHPVHFITPSLRLHACLHQDHPFPECFCVEASVIRNQATQSSFPKWHHPLVSLASLSLSLETAPVKIQMPIPWGPGSQQASKRKTIRLKDPTLNYGWWPPISLPTRASKVKR